MPEPSLVQVHIARRIGDAWEYLAVKRAQDRVTYPGIWSVVTGRIEQGELATETALRELYEETALRPTEMYCLPILIEFFSVRQNLTVHVPVFGMIVAADADVIINDEHSDFRWLPYDDIIDILPLPGLVQGTTILREYILDNEERKLFHIPLA